jgi:hypothetical protein
VERHNSAAKEMVLKSEQTVAAALGDSEDTSDWKQA